MSYCVFVTFQCGILSQVWYLIPDHCPRSYFKLILMAYDKYNLILFVTIDHSMTFYPILGNLRKKCALDYVTTTYLNDRNLQFLDSLMDSRMSFALKRCGFESSSISVSFFFFFLSLFILCTNEYINLNWHTFNKFTLSTVNNSYKPI